MATIDRRGGQNLDDKTSLKFWVWDHKRHTYLLEAQVI
jgi:hypothetical protein